MGISGGETGARTGPALMLGYEKEIPEDLISLISKVAAKADGRECVGLYKGFGTGHFIKMLHNGIEYAEMQINLANYESVNENFPRAIRILDSLVDFAKTNGGEYFHAKALIAKSSILSKKGDAELSITFFG